MLSVSKKTHVFLSGGGEMGERTRNFDWDHSPIGNPDSWPQSLKTAVGIVLTAKFPMFLWWGEELIQFYNDAYRPSLGVEGKHPGALGARGEETWQEIWPVIFPLIEKVMKNGESVWSEDQLLPIYSNGRLEEVYWTFSYSPVHHETGIIGGVLVTCTETTRIVEKLRSARQTELEVSAREQYFRGITDSMPAVLWLTDPAGYCLYLNKQWYDITGQSKEESLGLGWTFATHPDDQERVMNKFLTANSSRADFEVSYRLKQKDGSYRWTIDKGTPRFEENGDYAGMIGTVSDVHDQYTSEEKAREVLAASQRELLSYFEQSPVGVATISGSDLRYQMVNPFYAQLLGRKPVDLVNKPLLEAVPEFRGQGFDKLLHEVIKTGKPYVANEVSVNILKNEQFETIYVDILYQPRKNEEGEISGVLVVATDVTAQVLARKKLEENEAKLKGILSSAPAGIGLFVGRDLIIENPNQTFIDIVGKGPDIEGRSLREVMPELTTENQPFLHILDNVFTTGKMFHSVGSLVKIVQHGEMTYKYYNITYTPLFGANGDVYAILDIAIEVTDQVKANQQLEEVEASLRDAIELAQLGTWSYDVRSGLITYSDRMLEWTGINPADNPGPPGAGIEEKDQPRVIAAITELLQPDSPPMLDIEYSVVDINTRQQRFVHVQGKKVFDSEGAVICIAGTSQDITFHRQNQKALEEEVQLRTEQLAAAIEELQITNEELEESNQQLIYSNDELAQYAYVASHDLQEPLRKIRVFVSRLNSEKPNPAEQKATLKKISFAAERMTQLIQDLLNLSKLLNNDSMLQPVKLSEIAASVTNDFELTIAEKEAEISIGDLPAIHAIGLQMNQLFFNLLSNALKFVEPGNRPKITITAKLVSQHHAAKYVRKLLPFSEYYDIMVTDNGIGFENQFAEQIFEVFKRLHGRDIYPGSGIGLSLCRRIAENHNGFLYAESTPHVGTRFHLIIPAQQRQSID